MSDPLSIYLHIPFCKSRCNYCDFLTWAGKEHAIPEYLQALADEIEITSRRNKLQGPVNTIYFGGGTPSILTPEQIHFILKRIQDKFLVEADAEITIEVNPGDCNGEFVNGIQKIGVNRVSLGMQSALDEELQRMGRRHTVADTQAAVRLLKNGGIENISLDLIFGYPGQTLTSWHESILQAMALEPRHVSLYALSIEKVTPLARAISRGILRKKSDQYYADAYHLACGLLADAGFRHYEISNWSDGKEYESRHNSQTWRLNPYLGFGAGAHGYLNKFRTKNLKSIKEYIDRIRLEKESGKRLFPAALAVQKQTVRVEMDNFMIFGLRLLEEGVNPARFQKLFGENLEDIYRRSLARLARKNALRRLPDGNLSINPDLAFVSNQIFVEFI